MVWASGLEASAIIIIIMYLGNFFLFCQPTRKALSIEAASLHITGTILVIFYDILFPPLSGMVSTSKAVMSEISDDSNQAFGLGVLGTAWGVGYILGPAISGAIADPIRQYNLNLSVSSKLELWKVEMPAKDLAMLELTLYWHNYYYGTTLQVLYCTATSPSSLTLPLPFSASCFLCCPQSPRSSFSLKPSVLRGKLDLAHVIILVPIYGTV